MLSKLSSSYHILFQRDVQTADASSFIPFLHLGINQGIISLYMKEKAKLI